MAVRTGFCTPHTPRRALSRRLICKPISRATLQRVEIISPVYINPVHLRRRPPSETVMNWLRSFFGFLTQLNLAYGSIGRANLINQRFIFVRFCSVSFNTRNTCIHLLRQFILYQRYKYIAYDASREGIRVIVIVKVSQKECIRIYHIRRRV